MDDRAKTADYEMRLYVSYLRELPCIAEQVFDILPVLESYGLSSPRIKSAEEAAYQSGTNAYVSDMALEKVILKDEKEKTLIDLKDEYYRKLRFCMKMQKRIADLSDGDKRLLYMRYFKGLSLRKIAGKTYSNKDSIRKQLVAYLLGVEK